MWNKEVEKLLFIPQHAVDKQREKAVEAQKENGDKAIRLSENDILVAIITKVFFLSCSRTRRWLTVFVALFIQSLERQSSATDDLHERICTWTDSRIA